MNLCIDLRREDDRSVLRVSGRLTEEGARELRAVCGSATPPIMLDLTDLQTANAPALETILDLQSAGAVLQGCSLYIAHLLDHHRKAR